MNKQEVYKPTSKELFVIETSLFFYRTFSQMLTKKEKDFIYSLTKKIRRAKLNLYQY